jgi:hypothetical protein
MAIKVVRQGPLAVPSRKELAIMGCRMEVGRDW